MPCFVPIRPSENCTTSSSILMLVWQQLQPY
jgi:hypothetical protein